LQDDGEEGVNTDIKAIIKPEQQDKKFRTMKFARLVE